MRQEIKKSMAGIFKINENSIPENIEMNKIVNWDSLNHLNLIVALEEKFKVSFEPDEIAEMVNIDKILEMIQRKTA
ncbi:acyl carrier protein [candidate division KSB1 bacterium]|nr:acyl carrier protein [candidate division KSB1 bacterium]